MRYSLMSCNSFSFCMIRPRRCGAGAGEGLATPPEKGGGGSSAEAGLAPNGVGGNADGVGAGGPGDGVGSSIVSVVLAGDEIVELAHAGGLSGESDFFAGAGSDGHVMMRYDKRLKRSLL